MDVFYIHLVWFLSLGCTSVLGISLGRCHVTMTTQRIRRIDRDHHCITVGRYHVCREWQCPPVDCFDDRGGLGKCRVCPGTCIDGGKVYRVGQTFGSVDGVNMCTCGDTIIPACSKARRPTYRTLCDL